MGRDDADQWGGNGWELAGMGGNTNVGRGRPPQPAHRPFRHFSALSRALAKAHRCSGGEPAAPDSDVMLALQCEAGA